MSDYDYVIEFKELPEYVVAGKPLGRHVKHDSRSKAYAAPERDPSTLVKVDWTSHIAQLDQGSLGSCTGNATVNGLGTDPYFATLTALIAGGLVLNEDEAVKIYSLATTLDGYSGNYPPDDTGSDGLSAAKAAQQLGFISGYKHALTLNAALTALQTGPVITGVSWYSGFDTPDANGLVKVGGTVRGGHEFAVVGYDPATKLVRARNSWGTSYGDNGYFYFSTDDWQRLLNEQGDVTIFTPLDQPAPIPIPVPTPTPPAPTPTPVTKTVTFTQDQLLSINDWANAPHWWGKATKAAKAWKAALAATGN